MPDGNFRMQQILAGLSRYVGETVTIYTKSGGDSGSGFTGVLIRVSPLSVTLLSDIGPAPACALGSCCKKRKHCNCHSDDMMGDFTSDEFDSDDEQSRNQSRINCRLRNTGAVVDIPLFSIAAFVHNAI